MGIDSEANMYKAYVKLLEERAADNTINFVITLVQYYNITLLMN